MVKKPNFVSLNWNKKYVSSDKNSLVAQITNYSRFCNLDEINPSKSCPVQGLSFKTSCAQETENLVTTCYFEQEKHWQFPWTRRDETIS